MNNVRPLGKDEGPRCDGLQGRISLQRLKHQWLIEGVSRAEALLADRALVRGHS